MAIKNKKKLLEEDFLSDQETKPLTADQVAGAPETTDGDDDFADLLGNGTEPVKAEPTSGSSEENAPASEEAADLKDVINELSASVRELKDTVVNMKAAQAPEAESEPKEDGATPDAPPNVDLDAAPAAEETPAAAPEAPAEPNTEDKPASEEAPAEEEETQDETAPGDETKSEAYRFNKKSGKLLNSNSGSIIGIVESGKLYKLDEMLMTVVKSKVRQKIEEAKKALKAELLGEELKASDPSQDCGNEKQIEEKKEQSFLDMIKSAKACKDDDKSCCAEEDKKDDEDKKSDEKKED